MNALHTRFFSFVLLAALAAPSMAQMGPAGSHSHDHAGHRMERMRDPMATRHKEHLASLKEKLNLQASQEVAWNTFAQAMQPPADHPARADRAVMEKMTTPERMERMQKMHEQHGINMRKRAEASTAFYGTLTDEQKKTFDAETHRFMRDAQRARSRHG